MGGAAFKATTLVKVDPDGTAAVVAETRARGIAGCTSGSGWAAGSSRTRTGAPDRHSQRARGGPAIAGSSRSDRAITTLTQNGPTGRGHGDPASLDTVPATARTVHQASISRAEAFHLVAPSGQICLSRLC